VDIDGDTIVPVDGRLLNSISSVRVVESYPTDLRLVELTG
jgi:hypothetical protein